MTIQQICSRKEQVLVIETRVDQGNPAGKRGYRYGQDCQAALLTLPLDLTSDKFTDSGLFSGSSSRR
jgi:hypothetical protein